MYNMLKMKKMNGLKIFALVLLSLSKFETMFGMKGNNIIDDEYVNKNYYLIDDLGNKITLDSGEDIKFKIYSEEKIKRLKCYRNKNILKIHENEKEKTLVITTSDNEEGKEIYLTPILYKNSEVILKKEKKTGSLYPMCFDLAKENRKKYKENTIQCVVAKIIGEDSINDDYILVDAENNKIEKIENKKIVFKLLTRKKYLKLKETLKDPKSFLKNNKGKYILDKFQNPLFFEKVNNNLILYVKCLNYNLCLAGLDLRNSENPINFIKDNSIKVCMAIKKGNLNVKEEDEEDDSSKCCCCIC